MLNNIVSAQLALILVMLIFIGCSSVNKRVDRAAFNKANLRSDICHILNQQPGWYTDALQASKKWDIPVHVLMATIYQESKFKAEARPVDYSNSYDEQTYLSTAYGYAQAIDSTWDIYKKATKQPNAKRNNFADAVDFMGWYMHLSHKKNNIPKYRTDLQYLNYHEGWLGYNKQSYRKKRWLLEVAQNVEAMSLSYKTQLRTCSRKYLLAAKKANHSSTPKSWF